MDLPITIGQGESFARGSHLEPMEIRIIQIDLSQVGSIGVHQINDLHLPVVRCNDCCSGHARMHSNKSCTGVKRDWWQLLQGLQGKDVCEGVEHISVLLPRRPAACCQKVSLRIHVTNATSVSIEGFDVDERVGVQDMNAAGLSGCANVLSSTFHVGILGFGW